MKRTVALVGGALFAASLVVVPSTAGNAAPISATRQIPSGGTTSFRTAALGSGAIQSPEFRNQVAGDDGADAVKQPKHVANRGAFPKQPLPTPKVGSSKVVSSNPELKLSFEGLNHVDQRTANGGNQFSVEPPDQALCVGNGYTVEAVNSVLRVYRTSNGSAATGVQDLNTFFGYTAAINRTTGVFGANVIDPICYYDPERSRFVVALTTLGSKDNGDLTGGNTIDVAVSNSPNPTGTWTLYHIPAQNDGTQGTPNHHCTVDGTKPGPCFQDYPHIGGDKYGIYITTNEYDLFGPSYNAAQVFAFSKEQLARHPKKISVTLLENLHIAGNPGWTVWPASSPRGQSERAAGGTEYLLSTITGDGTESGNPTGTANKIGLWAISNTRSLDSSHPNLSISSRLIDSETVTVPPTSNQKAGDTPLRDCLNDRSAMFGKEKGKKLGCWYLFFDPPRTWPWQKLSHLDSGDGRMQQTWFVNGTLWGSAGTGVKVNRVTKAGIAWFAVKPWMGWHGVQGRVVRQGYLGLAGNNLTYPAIAMGTNGKGAIAFTVVGSTYHPSAGYVTISADGRVGPIHIAAAGAGPDDGFTSYSAFVGNPPRTRWGDYGAAVPDGSSIWIASEYIAQDCTLAEYLTDPVGSCGGTRTALANWSTRVSKLVVAGPGHGHGHGY